MIWHALLIRPLGYKGSLNDSLSLPIAFGLPSLSGTGETGSVFPNTVKRSRLL